MAIETSAGVWEKNGDARLSETRSAAPPSGRFSFQEAERVRPVRMFAFGRDAT